MPKSTKDEETYHPNRPLLRLPWTTFPALLLRPPIVAVSEDHNLQDIGLWPKTRKADIGRFGWRE